MNESLAVITFVLLGGAILVATAAGRSFLFGVSAFIIVASNATVAIQVDLWGFAVSWGVIIYSLIYLITDILSEHYERHAAYRLAAMNLAIQALFWGYLFITFPIEAPYNQDNMDALLVLYATTPRITFAAFLAALGAFADIWFYEWLKKYRYTDHFWGTLWFRNNFSTFVGQSVNTVIFFYVALYDVVPDIWSIIITALIIKYIIAIFDTPILYFTRYIMKSKIGKRIEREIPDVIERLGEQK